MSEVWLLILFISGHTSEVFIRDGHKCDYLVIKVVILRSLDPCRPEFVNEIRNGLRFACIWLEEIHLHLILNHLKKGNILFVVVYFMFCYFF